MFKVLVISYYFPPMGMSGVQRIFKFVRYMKNYNWEPTVVTTGKTGYFAHDNSLLKECEDANIRVIRTEALDPYSIMANYKTVGMPPEWLRKTLSRISKTFFIPDNKIFWSSKAHKIVKELISKENFDIIFVSIPPFSTFSMASKIAKEFDIPLFVDYRDLWTSNQFSFNLTPYHSFAHKRMEYKALKIADKVITINRRIKEKLLSTFNFLTFEDVIILPQGYDEEDFAYVTPEPKLNNKLRLTYAGIFYEFITPKFFLKAFKELIRERPDVTENIELQFIGHLRKENQKYIKKLGLQTYVKDFGYLDHAEALKKIVSSDVLWMMIGKGRNSDSISTGKLYEYFGSRKPIIASVPAGAAKIAAQEYGAAFITEPDNIDQIKEAILTVHNLYRTNCLPQPNNEFVEKHRRDYLTEQLTKHFQFYLKEV